MLYFEHHLFLNTIRFYFFFINNAITNAIKLGMIQLKPTSLNGKTVINLKIPNCS